MEYKDLNLQPHMKLKKKMTKMNIMKVQEQKWTFCYHKNEIKKKKKMNGLK